MFFKIRLINTIFLFVLLIGFYSCKDSSTDPEIPSNLSGPYLGQKAPTTAPDVFGRDFISVESGIEFSLAISPDGNEMYFARSAATTNVSIWVTKQVNNVWTKPVPLFTDETFSYSAPFITSDGKRMYFISDRNGTVGIYQIWYMDRSGSEWSAPKRLEITTTKVKNNPTVASNGNLYYSELGDDGRYYIYMAKNTNGTLETPVKLGSTVNYFFNNLHPYISPDEKFLLFDATPIGYSNQVSYIYISVKKNDGSWTQAQPVNSNVNLYGKEYNATLSPDGKYMFFSRYYDIMWVDISVLAAG
jgi:Tol biopolymer transport system component